MNSFFSKQPFDSIIFRSGVILMVLFSVGCNQKPYEPDLTKIIDPETWTLHNREILESDGVYLNAQPGDGFLKLNNYSFDSGIIELDIKGKDLPGRSFVGFAFHGLNDSTFDAVYFRPFNFKNPERNTHSVQYISHPKYTWSVLRQNHPGEYENKLDIVPDPNEWFHVKLVIADHQVKAYVENSETPCLEVTQISHRTGGWIGFWTGFNSEGAFRNLKIFPSGSSRE